MEGLYHQLHDQPALRAIALVVASIAAAAFIELVIRRTVLVLVRRTETELDDLIVQALRRPIFISIFFFGLSLAAGELELPGRLPFLIDAALETIAALVWASAALRIGLALFEALSRRAGGTSIIQPQSLPIFDMLIKVAVIGAALYFTFLAWQIDLTAWLASAGIIGIAVGFAAKDSLANLFSGIFIVADAPYKLGDMIVLDGGLRGQVIKIGVRSTRILTRDGVEITVPNGVIGNSTIVNETGGPHVSQRIRVGVDAAYGSDIDRVREVLLECPHDVAYVVPTPPPQVRFSELGSSGLRFELLVWIEEPARRDDVLDALHCKIYKAFAAAAIEIPYAKHDVYIKETPPAK